MASTRWQPRRTRVAAVLGFAFAGVLLWPEALRAIQILTVDTSVVSFSSPSATDFDAGYVEKLSANTLTVESDVDWKLAISGSVTTWSCSGIECWTSKPRADIEWRESLGSYAALTGTAATVTTGTDTTPGTEDVVVDYRVKLDWTTDAPGTYDYDFVVFELSAI